jgi:pyruvate dehydrogenase complex dehydrogenase (E1) component
MVEHLSDEALGASAAATTTASCTAYKTAIEHDAAPTVVLAKTEGWTLGTDFSGNATHQIKKMTPDQLKHCATASTWRSRTLPWKRDGALLPSRLPLASTST